MTLTFRPYQLATIAVFSASSTILSGPPLTPLAFAMVAATPGLLGLAVVLWFWGLNHELTAVHHYDQRTKSIRNRVNLQNNGKTSLSDF